MDSPDRRQALQAYRKPPLPALSLNDQPWVRMKLPLCMNANAASPGSVGGPGRWSLPKCASGLYCHTTTIPSIALAVHAHPLFFSALTGTFCVGGVAASTALQGPLSSLSPIAQTRLRIWKLQVRAFKPPENTTIHCCLMIRNVRHSVFFLKYKCTVPRQRSNQDGSAHHTLVPASQVVTVACG